MQPAAVATKKSVFGAHPRHHRPGRHGFRRVIGISNVQLRAAALNVVRGELLTIQPFFFLTRWSDNGIEDLFFLGRSGCFISRLYGLFGQEVRPPWALAQADAGKVMEWGVMYLNVRASRGNIAFASKRIDVYRLASGQWLVEAMHQFRIS